MYSAMDQAMEMPSYVLVPRPISSRRIRLRAEILLRILAVSFISTMKVDSPEERLSEAPTRVKSLSTHPILAEAAGTKEPAWLISTMSAVCRKIADLPAILGPVIINTCSASVSSRISLGIYSRSEEHTSELQSLMRISYAVFCLKKKNKNTTIITVHYYTH